MCPHVSIQVSLRFKHLPTHFAFGIWCPITVLVCNIQLVLSLTLPPVVSDETMRLLQPMDDEEVSGQRAVWGVAQAALLTLVGRAIRLVLGNVLVESCDVFSGEAADGTLMNFKDVHLEPLQRPWVGAPGIQTWRPLVLFWLPFGAEGLQKRLKWLVRNDHEIHLR